MNDSLVHRGPDDSGIFIDGGIGLAPRRLLIVDLSGGHQPLFNEDSTVVVYNGEIFNFQDLSEELIAHGHTFRTRCDTEVIVHAWEQWGEACVERSRGQFAFALWDSNTETLFLARDRLGIKPLHYAELADGTVIFGSEMKAFLEHPDVPRTMDVTAVEDYFAYGYVPDPKSIYTSIRKLAPGHTMVYSRTAGRREPRAFWDVAFDARVPEDETAICGELIERLSEAVGIRLIADVPLGAFLSGGVDSSGVVALMAGQSSEPVDTCSIAFNVRGFDESAYAAQIAERYTTRHRVRAVDPDSFDLIDRLAHFYDEPYADSSAMPTYRVCALAREKVTVALSGDGGGEVFAGYRRYRWHHYEETVRSLVPSGLRRPLFGALGAAYPKIDWAPKPLRAKSTLEALARDSAEGYFHSVSVLNDDLRRRLFSDAMKRDLQGYHALDVLRYHMDRAPTDNHLSRVQYADFKTYLPGDILTKVDRASMATSLEVRVPILDHEFLGWAVSLPPSLKLRNREGKYILKKALEPLVPDDVHYRPKMGFAVPLADWFRGPLRERIRSVATEPALADAGIFDMGYVSTLVDQHQSGARDHSATLWALVMFESFMRQVHSATAEPPRVAAAGS